MAINLINLLQAAASGVGDLVNPDDMGEDIQVMGRERTSPSATYENDPAPIPVSNRSQIEETRLALGDQPKRKEDRGLKGTLRNVLGVLGDAFLLQSGNAPTYRPRREREKESDALSGFTQNPIAAIERMAQVNPKSAQEMYDALQKTMAQQAQIQSLERTRQNTVEQGSYKRLQDFGNFAARILQNADTPEKQAIARQIINTRAASLGIDPAQVGVTEGMGDIERELLGASDMTVNQQQQIPLRERQLDISQQNADSNTTRANREPQPRATPNPTNATLAAPLLAKVERGETLTKGQQEYLDRLGYSADRGQRGSRRRSGTIAPAGSSGGGKMVIRNGKLVPQ